MPSLNYVVSRAALTISLALLAACGSATEARSEDAIATASELRSAPPAPDGTAHPEVFACKTNSDCIAVAPAPMCCNNGWKIAINHAQHDAYDKHYACQPRVCAHYIIIERRVPACGSDNACQMVEP